MPSRLGENAEGLVFKSENARITEAIAFIFIFMAFDTILRSLFGVAE